MMREKFNAALKEAMKVQDKRRISTLRLINAAVKDRDIASRGSGQDGASDEDVLQILSKMIKQRVESSQVYEQAGRLDLAQQEREEMEIIQSFLPRQLDENEMKAACQKAIADTDASGLKDMGKCMGRLKEQYPGRMDFGQASRVVKTMLSN